MPGNYEYDQGQAGRIAAAKPTAVTADRRRRVIELLDVDVGESLLSIGCGSGGELSLLAAAVGEVGRVHGIDKSGEVLAQAEDQCADFPQVTLERADATDLPVPDSSFDTAVASLVYDYVPDVDDAVSELYRALRPGGRAVLVSNDWDSLVWHSTDADRMDGIVEAWTEAFANPRIGSRLASYLRQAGFAVTRVEPYSILSTDLDGYAGLIRDLVAGKLESAETVDRSEIEAWERDLQDLDSVGETFFNLTNYLYTAQKPE